MDHVKFFLESNESVLPSFYGLYVNKFFSHIEKHREARSQCAWCKCLSCRPYFIIGLSVYGIMSYHVAVTLLSILHLPGCTRRPVSRDLLFHVKFFPVLHGFWYVAWLRCRDVADKWRCLAAEWRHRRRRRRHVISYWPRRSSGAANTLRVHHVLPRSRSVYEAVNAADARTQRQTDSLVGRRRIHNSTASVAAADAAAATDDVRDRWWTFYGLSSSACPLTL